MRATRVGRHQHHRPAASGRKLSSKLGLATAPRRPRTRADGQGWVPAARHAGRPERTTITARALAELVRSDRVTQTRTAAGRVSRTARRRIEPAARQRRPQTAQTSISHRRQAARAAPGTRRAWSSSTKLPPSERPCYPLASGFDGRGATAAFDGETRAPRARGRWACNEASIRRRVSSSPWTPPQERAGGRGRRRRAPLAREWPPLPLDLGSTQAAAAPRLGERVSSWSSVGLGGASPVRRCAARRAGRASR